MESNSPGEIGPGQDEAPPVSTDDFPAISDQYRLQFEKAQDAWVLLFPEGMIKLNSSAAEILQRSDGTRTVQEIIDDLESTFGEEGLGDDIKSFYQMAIKHGWVNFV